MLHQTLLCTALNFTSLHRPALSYTLHHYSILYYITIQSCTALLCTTKYCTLSDRVIDNLPLVTLPCRPGNWLMSGGMDWGMDGWMKEWMEEWMDGWMDGGVEGYKSCRLTSDSLTNRVAVFVLGYWDKSYDERCPDPKPMCWHFGNCKWHL